MLTPVHACRNDESDRRRNPIQLARGGQGTARPTSARRVCDKVGLAVPASRRRQKRSRASISEDVITSPRRSRRARDFPPCLHSRRVGTTRPASAKRVCDKVGLAVPASRRRQKRSRASISEDVITSRRRSRRARDCPPYLHSRRVGTTRPTTTKRVCDKVGLAVPASRSWPGMLPSVTVRELRTARLSSPKPPHSAFDRPAYSQKKSQVGQRGTRRDNAGRAGQTVPSHSVPDASRLWLGVQASACPRPPA
jgi:hypothetical protein